MKIFFWVTLYPFWVKTVARFNAEDPWNHNHRVAFTVDAYLMARKGSPVPEARRVGDISTVSVAASWMWNTCCRTVCPQCGALTAYL